MLDRTNNCASFLRELKSIFIYLVTVILLGITIFLILQHFISGNENPLH